MSYKMPNIYPDELQRVVPAVCMECKTEQGHTDHCRLNRYAPLRLHIDDPSSDNVVGTGWIGHYIVSFAIVHMWVYNECLQQIDEGKNLYVLSERGQLFAERRIPDNEVRLPPDGWWGKLQQRNGRPVVSAEGEVTDEVVEGLLFSKAGTCQLCHASMDKFGQISHAKSHINKGHPVIIEEVGRKKIAKIVPGAELPLPKPPPAVLDPGSVTGGELFSSTGVCQVCSKTPHLFGRISHAKSHISKGDPVEIRLVKKKSVAFVTGTVEAGPRVGSTLSADERENLKNGQWREPEDHQARIRLEQGIEALQKLSDMAGNPLSRSGAEFIWGNMTPENQEKTLGAWLETL